MNDFVANTSNSWAHTFTGSHGILNLHCWLGKVIQVKKVYSSNGMVLKMSEF